MATAGHSGQYKNASKASEIKEKRRAVALQRCKFHRERVRSKRRNLIPHSEVEDPHPSNPVPDEAEGACGGGGGDSDGDEGGITFGATFPSLGEIAQWVSDDSNPQQQFIHAQKARLILSRHKYSPIDEMIESGIISKLISFLEWDHNEDMQYECAWALTNVACGNNSQTLYLVHFGAVPRFISLLRHSEHTIVEHAVWALANIAGDGPATRDFVLASGIVEPLLELVKEDSEVSFLQNVAWAISNLCRYKNPPACISYMLQLLPTIVKFARFEDFQIRLDAYWSLAFIAEGTSERIEKVTETGIIPAVVESLKHEKDQTMIAACLRVIGNILTGSDEQAQLVIDLGIVPCFGQLIHHEIPEIVKDVVWAISNLAAGVPSQIQVIVDENIMPKIVELLIHSEYKIRREACWAVTNFTIGASHAQTVHVMNLDSVQGLCGILDAFDARVVNVSLDGIANLLYVAEKIKLRDKMLDVIEECGGLQRLERLQEHPNESIRDRAVYILDNYLAAYEDGDQCPFTPYALPPDYQERESVESTVSTDTDSDDQGMSSHDA